MIKIDFTTKPTIPYYILNTFGDKCTYDENGRQHSYNDLPAIITTYGSKYWYKHGLPHRDNGLPAVIIFDGRKQYWVNGERIK